MTHLGKLTGSGQIMVGTQDVGAVEYYIEVQQPRYLEAFGEIEDDPALISSLGGANDVSLELEGGGQIKIILTRWSYSSGTADIAVSGDIPDF